MNKIYIDSTEKKARLYCTPAHIVKALLKREFFPGSIWEPAAGRGDIVKVLQECGYERVLACDLNDWGFRPCTFEDFLRSELMSDSLVTNPPFDLKAEFVAHAKRRVRNKIALLMPVEFEYTVGFIGDEADRDFAWKALYTFPQSIKWLNVAATWGMVHVGWYVFERGYVGSVLREKIMFRRNKLAGSAYMYRATLPERAVRV
jgi:hypothetical protein